MTVSSQSFAFAILLLSLQLGLTSGLQHHQSPSASIASVIHPVSIQHQQSTFLCSASVARDGVDETTSDVSDNQNQPAYDWDEQFEELQSFMSEYGHCNFPRSPSVQMEQKYPMLKRFCRDQRKEYKLLQQKNTRKNSVMTLRMFDRDVRCRRLGELGFEFNSIHAQWYDHYHELIQHQIEKGSIRVQGHENEPLSHWVYDQRKKRNGGKSINTLRISDSQIKLLDEIGFQWKSELYDEVWNENYQALVAFRNKHGHLMMKHDDPLCIWMNHQRQRRLGKEGAALTDDQIRLLDEIDFPWKAERYDLRWHAKYNDLQRFQKKHGHCQPSRKRHRTLYNWSLSQQVKHRKGRLSAEKIALLEEISFPLERKYYQWSGMYGELAEYSKTHGHLRVNKDDNPDLCEWVDIQRKRYHDTVKRRMLSDQQIEELEDLHFCWSLDWRERTWHEKYTEAVEFFKEHGHVLVTKKDNTSLFNWIEMQEKRYKEMEGQKPLSEEELEMLEQIDLPFLEGQPRMGWNAKYAEVKRYRDENEGRLPTSHKDDSGLNCWIRQQRHRYRRAYGYAALSDEQKVLLESIGFPKYPTGRHGRRWYEKYDELVEFWKQNGHFVVGKEEHSALCVWAKDQRIRFNGVGVRYQQLSKMEIYLLERIGFSWSSNRNEFEWQQRYEELVEFLKAQGRFPRRSKNPQLHTWMHNQRQRFKGRGTWAKLSAFQIQQLEKIGVV